MNYVVCYIAISAKEKNKAGAGDWGQGLVVILDKTTAEDVTEVSLSEVLTQAQEQAVTCRNQGPG